jgi:hypothetical protein
MDHSKDTIALPYVLIKPVPMVFGRLELLGHSHFLDLDVSKTWQMYSEINGQTRLNESRVCGSNMHSHKWSGNGSRKRSELGIQG